VPGLNNVIRSVTRELRFSYGVKSVLGIRGGYRGLDPARGKPPMELTEEAVSDIHQKGGTLLGTCAVRWIPESRWISFSLTGSISCSPLAGTAPNAAAKHSATKPPSADGHLPS